jgi:nucleoid DNA-binding protein
MNKTELIAALAEKAGLNKRDAEKARVEISRGKVPVKDTKGR